MEPCLAVGLLTPNFDTFRRTRVISASIMNARVLVLNASFEPINVCTERRAVVMMFKGVARMEEHNGHMLHSEKITFHAPSVIRLTEYRHIPSARRSLSRKNILLRDHSCRPDCGKHFAPVARTVAP